MSDWLVFTQESHAKTAVTQIDAKVGNPRKGRSAATGKREDNKVGTVTWAIPVQRLDGKWVFPRCPEADPSRPFDVETYDPAWFPQEAP